MKTGPTHDGDAVRETPVNASAVAVHGGSVVVLYPHPRYTPTEARELAAWLVVVAGCVDGLDTDDALEQLRRDVAQIEQT